MADVKISALLDLGTAPAANDYVPIVDASAAATKRVTIADLFTSPDVTGTLTADGLTNSGKLITDYRATNNAGINTSSTTSGFYKIGTMQLANSQAATIKVLGTAGYGSGSSVSGQTVIHLRGDNGGTTLTGHFYGETGGEETVVNVGYVNTATNTFDIYIEYTIGGGATYASLESIVDTGGDWTPVTSMTNIGSAPAGYAALPSKRIITTSGTPVVYFASNNDISFYEDTGTTAKFFWDASAERLGIGTASPATRIHGAGNLTNEYVAVQNTSATGGSSRLKLYNTSDTDQNGFQIINNGDDGNVNILNYKNSALAFWTNTSEHARIDSTGKLLIAKTTSGATNTGFEVNPNSWVSFVCDSANIPMYLENKAAGGNCRMSFTNNDHGQVSIGINSDSNFTIFDTPSSSTIFAVDAVAKTIKNVNGIYLGGTGGANLLDDYEEGTFTPVVESENGFTVGASPSYSGTYTKIGRIVHLVISLDFDSTDSVDINDRFLISGLPFTRDTSQITQTGCGVAAVYSSYGTGVNAQGVVFIDSLSKLGVTINAVQGSLTHASLTRLSCTYIAL